MEEEVADATLKSYSLDEQHTKFVTSAIGTPPSEILYILFSISITPLLVSLLTPWIVPENFIPMAFGDVPSRNVIRTIIEYPIMGVLPLLIITVFAGDVDETQEGFYQQLSYCVPTILVLTCVGIVIVNHSISSPTWNSLWTQCTRIQNKIMTPNFVDKASKDSKKRTQQHIPFLTTFRAMIIYITVLSILAIDFQIFPRRFAKTKAFGFSLMDVGTGSFVFANGIVSPEARRRTSNFRQSIISSVPLFVLGFIRLITVKGIEYHEVVEEYGVHWNFFFTLAVVKVTCAALFSIINTKHSIKIGFIIALVYDAFLVHTGFQNDYILNASIPRTGNLLDANREGIFSCVGYICIYMMSIYCGQLIYHGKNPRTRFRDWIKYVIVAGLQIFFLWFLVYFSHNYWNRSSRRAGNMTYVLWAVSSNYTVLWFHAVFFLIQNFLQHTGLIYGPLLFHQLKANEELYNEARKLKKEIEASRRMDEAKLQEEAKQNEEGVNEMELIRLEGKLGLMEEKLRARKGPTTETEANKSNQDEVSQKELEELAEEMEKDLEHVRQKSKEDKSFKEIVKEIHDSEANVAFLPDLTLTPITSTAICYNGLFVFLLGNLLTGGINSMVVSMYTPDAIALVILWSYATLIVTISVILYFYRIQLRFW